jgi:glycosyltransferase involved in cell wall biosynthesis
MGKEGSLPIKAIRALAGFLYQSSEHIVVVTPAFREDLISKWGVPPEKISIVENGVETELFTPDGGRETVKSLLGLQGHYVVSYIGTLGLAHGLNTVIQAATQLKGVLPDIIFLFVGEGADKERLISLAREKGLSNVLFLPQQPRERVPSIIRASDTCLVPLRKADVFKTVIPTKMLEIMACGRPIILGVDGQARQVLDEARAGLFVEPEDPEGLTKALMRLYGNAEMRESLGMNGRSYILNHLSREQTAKDYITVLNKVTMGKQMEMIGLPLN